MARENVSFTRYYYKVLIWGGGLIDVYTKKHGRTTRAAWDRMLYQDPCICWFKLQRYLNPKMTRKEEAQFLLPPPPHTHTHTCAGAIHKGSVFEKCFLSEVITLNTKFAPLSPTKAYQTPYVLRLPLCVLYHKIDSSDQ